MLRVQKSNGANRQDKGVWEETKVRDIFLSFEADNILKIPLNEAISMDNLIWNYTKDDIYSVWSCYNFIWWFNSLGEQTSAS